MQSCSTEAATQQFQSGEAPCFAGTECYSNATGPSKSRLTRRAAVRAQNAAAMQQGRQRQHSPHQARVRAQNAVAMQRAGARPRVEATRHDHFAQHVMNGIRQVQLINVGRMEMQCQHCGAMCWQRENTSICCGANGHLAGAI